MFLKIAYNREITAINGKNNIINIIKNMERDNILKQRKENKKPIQYYIKYKNKNAHSILAKLPPLSKIQYNYSVDTESLVNSVFTNDKTTEIKILQIKNIVKKLLYKEFHLKISDYGLYYKEQLKKYRANLKAIQNHFRYNI